MEQVLCVLADRFPSSSLPSTISPGLCPDWEAWDPNQPVENAREAMQQADDWLGVPQVGGEQRDPERASHGVGSVRLPGQDAGDGGHFLTPSSLAGDCP